MNLDRLVVEFDRVLRTLHAPARSQRPLPGRNLADVDLDEAEKRHVVGLLRVDHCGEVCAQALYQGQALTSRNAAVCDALREAADEEGEHGKDDHDCLNFHDPRRVPRAGFEPAASRLEGGCSIP